MTKHQERLLRQAIASMREACDGAERSLARAGGNVFRATCDVSRALHNGINNAMASVESAVGQQEYVAAVEASGGRVE